MTSLLRKQLDRALTMSVTAPLLRPLQRGTGMIFMLHRFSDPQLGVDGHDPDLLAECLRFLRSADYEVVGALELIRAALDGGDISRRVAFTIDDGHEDFDTVGAEVFRSQEAPVTVFVSTGAVGGRAWYWWERVQAGLERTSHSALSFRVGERMHALPLSGLSTRVAAAETLTASLKRIPRPDIDPIIDRLLEQLEVELPDTPPRRFSAMGWDAIRRHAAEGVEFGPHTVTHPVVSRIPAERVRWEVDESWRRLQEEVPEGAVPLFCYPNGDEGDFGPRDFDILRAAGMEAAVSSRPRYITHDSPDDRLERYAVPRFALPDTFTGFKSIVLGVERLVAGTRRRLAAGS